jgi:hypothetical protein
MPMSPRLLRPIASGSFDPRTISGLSAWIDFSDTTTIGPNETGPGAVAPAGELGYIKDKFVSGYAYTQSTGANRPVLGSINGLAAGDWGSGANTKRLVGSSGSRNTREVTAVFTWSAGGSVFPGFETILGSTTLGPLVCGRGTLDRFGRPSDGITLAVQFLNNTATDTAFPAIASGSPFVVQAWGSSNLSHTPQIGMDRTIADRGWRGLIGEMVAYNRELTVSEREAIRKGLARKWKFAI